MAFARELAERLHVAESHVARLIADGVLPPRGAAGWDVDACALRLLDYRAALCLVRGVAPAELGIDAAAAARVLRWIARLRGVAAAELGLAGDAAPWDLGAV